MRIGFETLKYIYEQKEVVTAVTVVTIKIINDFLKNKGGNRWLHIGNKW